MSRMEGEAGVGPRRLPVLETPVPFDASLADQAYYKLRDRIVSLDLAPGELVREDALMEELDMSRTPIREALLRLAQERLVRILPRRGTFVTSIHVGEVKTVYEFRRELEAIAAGWAAQRRRDHDFPLLRRTLDLLQLDETDLPELSNDDPRSKIAIDHQVHEVVALLSGNNLLEYVLNSYYYLTLRTWFLASSKVQMDEPFKFLPELIEAIMIGDSEASASYARDHSKYAEATIRDAL